MNLVVQYPFRLLVFVGFLLSFGGGSILMRDSRFRDIPLLAVLVIAPTLAVYPSFCTEFFDLSPTLPRSRALTMSNLLARRHTRASARLWRHGATVELDLTWQALRQPNRDYTVFMHILDADGKEWADADEKPQGTDLSTLKWTPGRVYSDTHTIQIDLNGPPEGYHLELGLYPATTGERALTETGADHVTIQPNGE